MSVGKVNPKPITSTSRNTYNKKSSETIPPANPKLISNNKKQEPTDIKIENQAGRFQIGLSEEIINDRLVTEIADFEGFIEKVKIEKVIKPDGKIEKIPTIGYGFNLKSNPTIKKLEKHGINVNDLKSGKSTIEEDIAKIILKEYIEEQAIADARKYLTLKGKKKSFFDKLPIDIQRVIVQMTYQHGGSSRIKSHKKLRANLMAAAHFYTHQNKKTGLFLQRAANEMTDSTWYRSQSTGRARVLKQRVRNIALSYLGIKNRFN